jgi:TolB-like protein
MSLVGELKRRNVFRVGAAYLVVGWLVLQIVDTVGPMLSLPDAFARGVLLLLAIGFPVMLVGSWVFELTPGGLRTQGAAGESGHRTSPKKLNAVIIAGLAAALVFVIVDAYVLVDSGTSESDSGASPLADDPSEATESSEKTVGVLPFVNNSPDPAQEYFADGLTDALLDRLTRVPDLRVAARASSYYYKGRDEDLHVIGQALGVDHIVLGSVSKAGNNVRVIAQLVSVADGFPLWSDALTFELSDVFEMQDEMAEQVATALEVTLATGDFSLPGNTSNVEAYDAALQARFLVGRLSEEGVRAGIRLAEQAVALDPEYARGWLVLRQAYALGGTFLSAEEGADLPRRAVEALQRAEAIAPELWEVQLSRIGLAVRSGQHLTAFQMLENGWENRALPEWEYDLHRGVFSSLAGQNQEAVVHLQRARLQNPFDIDLYYNLAIVLFRLGRYEEAMSEIARGEALDEETTLFSLLKARVATQQENWAEAEAAYAGAAGEEIYPMLDRYLQSDNRQQGLDALREYLQSDQPSIAVNLALAEYASLLGDPALSLELLNAGREWGGGYLGMRFWDPGYSAARQHPGFKTLARNLGLVEFWRATGDWGDYCRPLEGSEEEFECFR